MTRASRIRGAVVAAASLAIVGLASPLPHQRPRGPTRSRPSPSRPTRAATPASVTWRGRATASRRAASPTRQLAQLGESEADLAPGETASENMTLLANIPKNGAFAAEGSFSSDLAFQGNYAYAGNYDGFTVYDISNPRAPDAGRPGALPRLAERRLRLRRPAVPVHRLLAQRQLLQQHHASRRRRRPRGRASRSSTSATRPTRSTSSPSRPPAARTPTRWCPSAGRDVYVYVSSYSPERDLPRLPAAARRHLASSRCRVRRPGSGRRLGRRRRCCSRDGGNPGGQPALRRPPAATTSPRYPAKDLAAGACMGDGILFDITDREQPGGHRPGAGQRELRVLALGDLQQRRPPRSSSPTSSAAAARRPATRQTGPNRGADGIYDIVGRRQAQARLPSYYKIPRAPGRHRELRGPQRLADPGQGQGHHGPGLVPGRRLRLGLHRLRATRGDRLLRARPAVHRAAGASAAPGRRTTTTATSTPTTSRRASTSCRSTTGRCADAERYRYGEFNPQSQPSFNG